MTLLELEGRVEEDDYAELKQENGELRLRVRELEREADQVRAESMRAQSAIKELRRVLNPLHLALRGVYGEIEMVVGKDTAAPPSAVAATGSSPSNPKWESWKQKLPGRAAEMIDLLLLHENMSVAQLTAAMHCGKDAVYTAASKLGQAGLVVKHGGKYSLRDL